VDLDGRHIIDGFAGMSQHIFVLLEVFTKGEIEDEFVKRRFLVLGGRLVEEIEPDVNEFAGMAGYLADRAIGSTAMRAFANLLAVDLNLLQLMLLLETVHVRAA